MTTAPSVKFPAGKNSATRDWNGYWAGRFEAAALDCGEPAGRAQAWAAIIREYLAGNPYVPSKIFVNRLESFLNSYNVAERADAARALYFFYNKVHASEEHRNTAEEIGRRAVAELGKDGCNEQAIGTSAAAPSSDSSEQSAIHQDQIKALETELKIRNYSRRTLKNYCSLVHQYLSWLDKSPSKNDISDIKRYQLYLKEDRKYLPRSINLVSAAITFFYKNVVNCEFEPHCLPRMKIGKYLPKVYSEREVEEMIGSTSNPKHRLILMLAYGCGLRLNEIRCLKPEDVDRDRSIIYVRHGKGDKDRIIGIDEVFRPELEAYLKIGAGRTWLFEGQTQGQRISARTIDLIFSHAACPSDQFMSLEN
jgi:site-specific recombinase XerD